MNKLLLIFMLVPISLPAFSDILFHHNDETENPVNITELKKQYAARAKYATYGIGVCLLCYILSSKHSYKAQEVFVGCGYASGIWGLGNSVKWLFLHLFPQSTASDVNSINVLEKLMYAILTLRYLEYMKYVVKKMVLIGSDKAEQLQEKLNNTCSMLSKIQ